MADFKKMNTKTALKAARELGIPVPEDATRETLIKLLEAHEAAAGQPSDDVMVDAGGEVSDAPPPVIPGQTDLEQEIDKITGQDKVLFEGTEHITCKNCGRDLIEIRDWQVMTPPGFAGEPNREFMLDHSYCSGCAVAVNGQLANQWTVTPVEFDEET